MAVVGFIGTGNMGSALARAAARGGKCTRILLANRGGEKARRLAEEIGGEAVDNLTAAAEADYLFLGVEPDMLGGLIASLRRTLERRNAPPVIVSMAAGRDLRTLETYLGQPWPVIRIMPNIPVSVGGGVVLYCASEFVTDAQLDGFLDIMSRAGLFSPLEERLFGAATGITGCGTAYACLFAEALADGGVACGLPRSAAAQYAAQMLLGAAEYLLETGVHPGELKDMVCSPGGSTIQGVRALEERGFRSAVMNAVIAAFEKKF